MPKNLREKSKDTDYAVTLHHFQKKYPDYSFCFPSELSSYQSFMAEQNLELIPGKKFKDDAVFIGECAALADRPLNLAIYARRRINKDEILGEYAGKRLLESEIPEGQSSFLMMINKKQYINAENAGNWVRFVNGGINFGNAEFKLKSGILCLVATQPINPGEQILAIYGNEYFFEKPVFLSTHDNWKSSEIELGENTAFYNHELYTDYMLNVMNLSPLEQTLTLQYLFPKSISSAEVDVENANLPILAYVQNGDEWKLLPQPRQEKTTTLMYACLIVDNLLFERLLACNADVNAQQRTKGNTALHYAIIGLKLAENEETLNKAREIIEKLIKFKSINLNLINSNLETPLQLCIKMKANLELLTQDSELNTLVITHLNQIIDLLLRKKILINTDNAAGKTPIHHCIEFEDFDTIKRLFEFAKDSAALTKYREDEYGDYYNYGDDTKIDSLLNGKNREGFTPLHYAISLGKADFLQKIISIIPSRTKSTTVSHDEKSRSAPASHYEKKILTSYVLTEDRSSLIQALNKLVRPKGLNEEAQQKQLSLLNKMLAVLQKVDGFDKMLDDWIKTIKQESEKPAEIQLVTEFERTLILARNLQPESTESLTKRPRLR